MADTVVAFRSGDRLNATRDTALVPGGVPNAVDVNVEPLKDDLIDVADLVRMFEESEDATYTARKDAERDRDYLDNKQLTDAEIATLNKRGQPPSVDNRIKTKIDYLVGFEKQQRVDPKAMPRTPKHDADADSATEALRYVADEENYDQKRSAVWRNMLVEGAGGVSVSVVPSKHGDPMDSTAMTPMAPQQFDIKISRIPWDRMFWDPHSSEPDFSDAGYKGIVIWMDYDDAVQMYPDGQDALDTTLSSAPSDTYDDKPKHTHWADKKRKRVRICQIWVKRGDDWHFAEYTKGGILQAAPSPHKDDKGASDCELLFQSAYVDRDNNRYGLIREMIPLQDEINKRRSKSLHILSVHQTTFEEGAISDIEKFRREKAKPDGTMMVAPGALRNGAVISETRTDLAEGHFKLLQEAKNSIDLKGPNATEMGDKVGGSASASGKAIIASQQGGMTQIGDLMDSLRHLDKRVYRTIWARIRQYWTAERWIRVTDDDQNIKWLGINVDPAQVQMLAQQNPEAAQRIAGAVGSVAELDCDIIIDIGPDGLTPQLEQFQSLVELKKFDDGNEIPLRTIIRAMPNMRDKEKMLAEMDKAAEQRSQSQEARQAHELQLAGAVAEVEETKSRSALNMARARQAMTPEQPDMVQPQQMEFEIPPPLQVAKAVADVDYVRANTENKRVMTQLAPAKANHDARIKEQQTAQRAKQMQQMQQMRRQERPSA